MFNEKLESIYSNFGLKKSEIEKKYEEYNSQVKAEKESKDKGVLINNTIREMELLKTELSIRLDKIQSEITEKTKSGIENPDIEKLVQAQEYNSAQLILTKRPTDIDRILKQAYEENRKFFADAIVNEVLSGNEYSEGIKHAIRYRRKEYEDKIGISNLKDERSSLRYVETKINEAINLAQGNPVEFERKLGIYSRGIEAYNKAEINSPHL